MQELDQTSSDKIQSAQYGLVLLEEKEGLEARCQELEGHFENTKHELTVGYRALHCTVLPCTVLHCTALHCTLLYYTKLPCTILYYTARLCPALSVTALHCPALHCTAHHCPAKYCTVLHWFYFHALHCTAL